jgi:hypothetical protein
LILRQLVARILLPILGVSLLAAAEFSTYRGFEFGEKLPSLVKRAGAQLSEARLVHQRPAVIQELEWRPRSLHEPDAKQVETVRHSLLRFYNEQLFQIVTTYDRDRIEGLTEADMVNALSLTYGTATKPGIEIPYHSNYGELARVLARWEDSEYSCDLIRTGDRSSFAVILSSKRLNALAQAAVIEAVRLDALEAPQRAIELQKKQEAEERLGLEKARSKNMPNFRP